MACWQSRVDRHGRAPRRVRLLALLCLAMVAGSAGAWGPVGHRTVGAIADEMLNPAARDAVATLLRDDQDREGRPSHRHSLAEVADWADEIRGTSADHPRWHYDNRPICEEPVATRNWCAQGECASAAFSEQLAILADRKRSTAERNEALKWVVHLAGDLHQPLHAADLAEGGNRIHVANGGRSGYRSGLGSLGNQAAHDGRERHGGASLHSFWDSHLVGMALHPQEGVASPEAMRQLLQDAREIDRATLTAPAEQWAQESNEIARRFALKIEGVGCAAGEGLHREDAPLVHLSHGYIQRAMRIADARLAQAGARLAYVLNETLGAQHGAGAPGTQPNSDP